MVPATLSIKSSRANCFAETFALTFTIGQPTRALCHAPPCRHASPSTQSSMAAMRLVCPATARKSSGTSRPLSGCSQRSRAYITATSPVFGATFG
jgi:hypothetical protein